MDYYTKVPFGLLLIFLVFLESTNIVQAGLQETNVVTTPKPVIYVTTPKAKPTRSTIIPTFKSRNEQNLAKKNVSSPTYQRNTILPQWSFPESFNDQIRQNSNYNLRHPIKTTVDPILSVRKDTSLTDQEFLQNLNVPATYESIVYNPDAKEATSAFSRSNFWETPELVVRDVNQREDRGNTLITTSNRLEYTPGSPQTPLNQIQYREAYNDPYRRPTSQPVYENQKENVRNAEVEAEEIDEGEDESGNQEVDEENIQENDEVQENEEVPENEEIQENDEEGTQNEKSVHSYPVNLDTRAPFNPFENVQEPNDIYSDVLSNIGSVFNDDHSSIPSQKSSQNIKVFNHGSANSLLPEFEQYSYENLQQKQREEDSAENEELTEYEDDDEGKESKPVPQQKAKEEVYRSPLNTIAPPKRKPEKKLKESPFPSVKIINEKREKPEKPEKLTLKQENSLPFSPWLPTQASYKHREPTPWPDSAPKSEKPIYQSWPKVAETKQKNSYKEPITSKPYLESYKKSYNKSWKTSSPEKDENSSYKTSWKSSEPEKPKNYKNEKGKKPKKSAKILRQSSSNLEKVIRRMEEPIINASGITYFVTPVPSQESSKINETLSRKY